MKKIVVVLLLLALLLTPGVAFSREELGSAEADINKVQLVYLATKFRKIRIDLFKLRMNLKAISSSMSAHESAQSYLINRSYKKIAGIEGICRYMEDVTGSLSLVDKDELSYYCSLKKYGVEQMRNRSNTYLNNIKKMRPHILNMAATESIDRAAVNIHSSSKLIDKVVKILQQCSGEKKADLHH